jgi:hypothetical protein
MEISLEARAGTGGPPPAGVLWPPPRAAAAAAAQARHPLRNRPPRRALRWLGPLRGQEVRRPTGRGRLLARRDRRPARAGRVRAHLVDLSERPCMVFTHVEIVP